MEREVGMAVAFVPVRGGSKSIPLKNIKNFCGRPLVYWVLSALEPVTDISDIIVATDSDEIEKVVIGLGLSKVKIYRRTRENAQDSSSTESVILEYLKLHPLAVDEIFMLVQATSPLTRTCDFIQSLKYFRDSAADSLLSCVRIKRFFWNDNGTPFNYDYENRPRRQEFNGLLMENGAIYINTVGNIIRHCNRLSGTIAVYEMPEFTSVELDEEPDWHIAENTMLKNITEYARLHKFPVSLFLCDVDGTLTDAGMYYDQHGNEMKKFNTRDGKGFELLRQRGVKTGLLTSEKSSIVEHRAKKLKIDYLIQGVSGKEKLVAAKELAKGLNIGLDEIAYVGDDINCLDLLQAVGYAGCPSDAEIVIKNIPGIKVASVPGGHGAVREFVNMLLGFSPLEINV